MALINSDSNLFSAFNLHFQPLECSLLPKTYFPFLPASSFTSLPPHLYSRTNTSSFIDQFRTHQKVNCSINNSHIKFTTYKQLFDKHTMRIKNAMEETQRKKKGLLQFLINYVGTARERRERHSNEFEATDESQEYYERINMEMERIEKRVLNIIDSEKETGSTKNMKDPFQYLEQLIKLNNSEPKLIFLHEIAQPHRLNHLINPLTLSFYKTEKQRPSNPQRVVFLNFGKETYLNVRAIKNTTTLLYLSFFNQYIVFDEKGRENTEDSMQKEEEIDENDENGTYNQMIEEEMYESLKELSEQNDSRKTNNTLLFPLNLMMWQDYSSDSHRRQTKNRPYQEFGSSSDILYLFQSVCAGRIRSYNPKKVVIYMDGTTIVDPLHFAEIVRVLSEICNYQIIFCTKDDAVTENEERRNKMAKEEKGGFFKRYMSYELAPAEVRTVINCATAFVNVTSRSYIPMAHQEHLPSQLFRQRIRYDYVEKHMQLFPVMKRDMGRISPSEEEKELIDKAIELAEEQIRANKDTIPYRQRIIQTTIDYHQTPIHYHQLYQISRYGVIYDILHRLTITQHKSITKQDKKNSEQDILEDITSLRFFKKHSEQSFQQIKLEEYSQVKVIRREKKIIVVIINYYNHEEGTHEMLFGSASAKSKTVYLNVLNDSTDPDSIVNVGYRIYTGPEQKFIYLTWPLIVHVDESFKARISGKVYVPEQSDRVLRIEIIEPESSDMDVKGCIINIPRHKGVPDPRSRFGARIFYMSEIKMELPKFYIVGGYSPNSPAQNTLGILKLDLQNPNERSYVIEEYPLKDRYLPGLIDYSHSVRVSKQKKNFYNIYDGRSLFYLSQKPTNIKFDEDAKDLEQVENKIIRNLKAITTTSSSGYFKTIDTYPVNKIIEKYFDATPRIRYTFRFNDATLTFDEEVVEHKENMLFLLIEGLDDTFPDAGVFVETEDKSRKYLTFLFNNPNRYDQPFYMTLNPKTFECYEKRNGENIILKQKGYKVYITAKGGRIKNQKKDEFGVEFVGDLLEVMQDPENHVVRMNPYKVEFTLEESVRRMFT